MKVTIYGIGYVGLVQAAVLADAGHDVCCVDVDQIKIDNLSKGIIPIYEPDLLSIVEKNTSEGRLTFTTDAIANDRTIDVFNNGKMQRDFTYIDDIVEGVVRIQDVVPNLPL